MAQTYQAPAGFTEQDTIRLGKLNALIEQGRNPYEITTYDRTHTSGQIREGFEALENQRVVATVDLSGLKAGSYGVPLVFPEEEYPDITFEPEPATVRVTLEARDAEE